MAGTRLGFALWHVQQLFHEGSATGLSDTQLLRRFAARRDEAAFASLLLRHGPMVLGVCRGILRDSSDVDDAFQATFLILARKAGSAWGEGQLGGWLHKVAYRIAVRASVNAATRRQHERWAAERAEEVYTQLEPDDEWRPGLHEEIARLPAKLRLPVVLCYLEGLTHAQAAGELSCGEATVRRRLVSARERLRVRLAKRGFAPVAAIVGTTLVSQASASVRIGFARSTIAAATRVAAGEAMVIVAGKRVASLAKEGLHMMSLGWKAAAVAGLCLATLGGMLSGAHVDDDKPTKPAVNLVSPTKPGPDLTGLAPGARRLTKPPSIIQAGEPWRLTLAEAVQIALDNAHGVRVVTLGASELPQDRLRHGSTKSSRADSRSTHAATVIMPLNSKESVPQFKSQVMAKLRSVEEGYYNLAQAVVQLSAAEQAVNLNQAVLSREQVEQAEGRGTHADVAEAAQRLEQFNLDLLTRTSDVFTTEREMRKTLGLPLADYRRIIPSTPMLEAQFEPDWETSLAEMKDQQPDIAEIKLAIANRSAAALPGTSDSLLEGLNQDLKRVIKEKTYSLAQFTMAIDANYKQFTMASRLRAAAAQRLDAQRAYYEEGRITIDRFLDAVSQYATAVATEAQYKATYNVAISTFEMAKGTLLASDNIVIAEVPRRAGVDEVSMKPASPTLGAPGTARGETTPSSKLPSGEPPATPAPPTLQELTMATMSATPAPLPPSRLGEDDDKGKPTAARSYVEPTIKAARKVWNFSFSIGRDRPFVVKGTISEGVAGQTGAADD